MVRLWLLTLACAVTTNVSALRWLATTSSLQKGHSLLHQMSPPQQFSEACSGCFRLLAVLCQRNSGRQAHATEVGGLQACLQCMSQPMLRSHDTAIHGCWLLMALCHKHPSNQASVSTPFSGFLFQDTTVVP
eukprot:s80_g28.t1